VVTLKAATPTITLIRYKGEPLYGLDLGVYALTGGSDLELRTTRPNYRTAPRADLILTTKGRRTTTRLPAGLVSGFNGLTGFSTLTLKNAAGATVLTQQQSWCPGAYSSSRTQPDAKAVSPYPGYCPSSPWTLGSVAGLPAHWAAPIFSYDYYGEAPDVPDGTYTATTTMNDRWRAVLKTPKASGTATVKVTIESIPIPDDGGGGGSPPGAGSARSAGSAAAGQFPSTVPADLVGRVDGLLPRTASAAGPGSTPGFAAPRPESVPSAVGASAATVASGAMTRAAASRVPNGHRPDLRSLPAFGVQVIGNFDDPLDTSEYLAFAATTWNAGPAPLVVDGYRQPTGDIMDAYQFFYDSKGKEVGWAPTGELRYDPRTGHLHWHFLDFAKYELISSAGGTTIRSQKEAWCLAPTDAVDLTVRGAQYQPYSTGLSTACGQQQALALRETLDSGWGDTYGQYLPGQAFDITNLPNGTYVIRVTANPDGHLLEGSMTNNVSNRTVILGGTKGARTVTVPPYEGLDIP
jgi:hypothetical protein